MRCREKTTLAERDGGRLQRELALERGRLEQVFRHAPSFLAIVRGPDHVLEIANDTFFDFIGRGREILGKPFFESVPEMAAQGYPELLDQVLRTGEPCVEREQRTMLCRTPGAPPEERFFEFTYVPLLDADGTCSGVIAHGTDVTAHVRARRAAEESARRRDEILGIVSHDLRSPMTVIAAAAAALTDPTDPLAQAQSTSSIAALIARAAASAHRMITDLLDIASIEAGSLSCEMQQVVPEDIVNRVLERCLVSARERGIALDVCCAADAGLLHADGERILQALTNLVSNALDFTRRGGRVVVSCTADASTVRFAVHDTGAGISKEDLPHVFDRFWQGRHGSTPRGTGLGLAIVRGIVEAHQGQLSVESLPTIGSSFSFSIPRR
jgi:signal transduction histidine kinase